MRDSVPQTGKFFRPAAAAVPAIPPVRVMRGAGTAGDPYQIATGAQLAKLAADVNGGEIYQGKYFVLTDDLNLATHNWTPIGYDNSHHTYVGTFDGQGHSVTVNTAVIESR